MKRSRKLAAISMLTALTLTGIPTPSQATGNPEVQMWTSSQEPNIGEPVGIFVSIYGCATMPTEYHVDLYRINSQTPFATLTKSTTGFKSRIVNGDVQMQWLYRGPTGDGVDNNPTYVEFNASGGCVVNPEIFYSEAEWDPTHNSRIPDPMFNVSSSPIEGGLIVTWSNSWPTADPVLFWEVQFSVANTDQWSPSRVTHDNPYTLTGLTKGVIYDLRVRATNRLGTSAWTISNGQAIYRTPGYYDVWAENSNLERKTTFAVGDTVTVHMHLTNCDSQPPIQNQWGGAISWTMFPLVNGQGDGWHALNGSAETSTNAQQVFDSQARTYDASFDLVGLTSGTYRLSSYIFEPGCSASFTPAIADGYPQGSTLQFTVGDHVPSVPFWGSAAGQFSSDSQINTITTRTSATITWSMPKNVLDGPFTYAVYLSDGMHDPKYLGTTSTTNYTITGLQASTNYQVQIRALNAIATDKALAAYEYSYFMTRAPVVAKKSKTTVVTFAKSVGLTIPKGATVTMAKSKDKLAFGDCTVSKNVLLAAKSVGACTIDITVTPKKVGKAKPKPVKTSYDVMISN